jgi:type III secretion protein L
MGALLRLKSDALLPAADQTVIKAGAYLDGLQARSLLEQARDQAEAILARAREEGEQERVRGHAEGLEAGKQVMAERIMAAAVRSMDGLAAMEEEMVNVVIQALKKIIGEMDDRERLVRIVRTALNMVRNEKRVTLRVPPAQADTATSALSELERDHPGISILEVVADPRLTGDDCVLESDLGIVDAGLNSQIEAIRKALLARIRHSQ